MPQKIHLEGATTKIPTGSVQFYDKKGQLDNAGLYLNRQDALSIAHAIEALDCYLKTDAEETDSVIYAVYFSRLLDIKNMIRNDIK